MFENLTVLSLAAMGLYVLVALGCSAGASAAMTNHQPIWHRNAWMLLALLFVALLVMRGIGAEEWARAALRDGLRSDDSYRSARHAASDCCWGFDICRGIGRLVVLPGMPRHPGAAQCCNHARSSEWSCNGVSDRGPPDFTARNR